MIFKTFNSDIDKSISKIGMFNKSFWAMQQDLKHGNGIGFSIFGGQSITSKDKQSILDLNTALKNGVKPAKAWATTMTNCSIAAQNQARQCLRTKGDLAELANGLDATTVSAKAAEIGLKALSIAGNMLLMWGISEIIGLAVTGISNIANEAENARESATNLTNAMKSASEESSKGAQTVSSLNERYQELSKGVNSLGENVSLTSTEYDEYKSIISQLSDAMPDLTAKFNAQGEKIGFVTSQLKDANKMFDEYQQRQADKFLTEGKDDNTVDDIISDYNKSRYGKSGFEEFLDSVSAKRDFWNSYDKNDLETMFSNQTILDQLNIMKDGTGIKSKKWNGEAYYDVVQAFDLDELSDAEYSQKLNSLIKEYEDKLHNSVENIKTVMSYMAKQTGSAYYGLSNDSQKIFNNILSGLSDDFINSDKFLDDEGNIVRTKVDRFVSDLATSFKSNYATLEPQFDRLLKINPLDLGKLSIPKAQNQVNDYLDKISGTLNIDKKELQTSLGFDDLFVLSDDYNKTINNSLELFTDATEKDLTKFFKKHSINTREEIDNWNEIAENASSAAEAKKKYLEFGGKGYKQWRSIFDGVEIKKADSSNDIAESYEKQADKFAQMKEMEKDAKKANMTLSDYVSVVELANEKQISLNDCLNVFASSSYYSSISSFVGSLNDYSTAIENAKKATDALQSALTEQNNQGYLTQETYQALIDVDSDYSNCLEFSAGYIVLNTEKANEMTKAKSEAKLAELEFKEALDVKQYNENTLAIERNKERIELLKSSRDGSSDSVKSEIEALEAQNETFLSNNNVIKDNIEQYDLLESNIRGTTSAYQDFLEALSVGNDGDRYNKMVGGLDELNKLYKSGGLESTKGKKLTEAYFGENFKTSNYKERLKEVKRYLTEDADGYNNFLKDLISTGNATKKDGKVFIKSTKEKIKKDLGITDAILEVMADISKFYGHELEFKSNTEGVDDLTEAANQTDAAVQQMQASIDKLNECGIDTTELQTQLDGYKAQLRQTKDTVVNEIVPAISKSFDELSNPLIISGVKIDKDNSSDVLGDMNNMTGVNVTPEQLEQAKKNQAANNLLKDIAKNGGNAFTATDKVLANITNINNIEVSDPGFKGLGKKVGTVRDNLSDVIGKINTINTMSVNVDVKTSTTKSEKGTHKEGTHRSAGTFGSSFANGYKNSATESSMSLVGEEGQELVCRNGRYFTVGDNGAEFTYIKKGDIVFNAEQTRRLFSNGSINSRGKSYATGTCYNNRENYDIGGSASFIKAKGSRIESNKSSKDKDKKDKSTKQLFDWIERKVKKFQTKFDRWKNLAENSATKFIDKYFKKASTNLKKLTSTEASAYSKYMSKANSIKFSKKQKKYRDKVVSGKISIENVKGDKLVDKIQKYQDYYDKAQSALDSFIEKAKELYELPLDKAAVKIEKFNDSIDLLDKKLSNAVGSKAKNALVDQQTKEQKSILDANNKAKSDTAKNVKSTGKTLTKSSTLENSGVSKKEKKAIKEAVKAGKEVDLSYFKEGSKGYKAAVKYNQAIAANKKATLEAAKSQEDYNRWLVESKKIKFDNIADDYEKRVQVLGYDNSKFDNEIAEIEASGAKVERSLYTSKKSINNQILAQRKQELSTLEKEIEIIPKGTEEYYDALDTIQSCKDAISECTKNTYELNNAINQLHFDRFEENAENIDRIISEQDFLRNLFEHEKMVDEDTGAFTDAGHAKLGSLAASYYASKEKAENDAAEVKELQRMLNSGSLHSDMLDVTFNSIDDLEKKLKEMYTQWQDDIKNTYDLESAIADVMKEQYQSQLDMLKDLIDRKKEALDTEKDLYEYQQQISEKTKDISTIKKQISAYSGDSSEEGFAKLQKLQKELADKEKDFRETEYDRYIQDQEDMLDKLYEEYEELVTKKLDDFMTLVREGLAEANGNTDAIKSFISSIMKDFGYTGEYDQNGIFNVKNGGNIQGNIAKLVYSIKNGNNNTNTEPKPENPTSTTSTSSAPSSTGTGSTPSAKGAEEKPRYSQAIKEKLEKVFDNEKYYAKGKKKKASDYKTSVNQYLFGLNKKVLTSAGLDKVRSILGLSSNSKIKDELLYIKKQYGNIAHVRGFKHGGIGELIKAQGEDGIALVRNKEGFIAPEDVPRMKQLIDSVPLMNDILEQYTRPNIPNFTPNIEGNNINAEYVFNLEKCENADDIIRQIQSSPKVQKAIQNVTIDRTLDGGRLGVKMIR